MTVRFSVRTLALAGLVLSSCHRDASPAAARPEAEFGIFFGAQIQQRQDLPLETDETKQQQGFRVVFKQPTVRPMTISWELDYPTARSGVRGPGNASRGQRKEQAELPAGAERFERRIVLSAKDYPGTWNLRVLVDNEVVLDRPFRVVSTHSAPK